MTDSGVATHPAGVPADLMSLSYEPLTPTAYLDRAAASHGTRTAVVDGDRSWTYAELHERCRKLAGGLAAIHGGRPVAVLVPNTHVGLEAAFGVSWSGAALVAVNTRLSAGEVAYILEHANASVLVHDPDFDELVADALGRLDSPPQVVRVGDDYERLITWGEPTAVTPDDERALLSINYTSGTTGNPKGVMLSHANLLFVAATSSRLRGLVPSDRAAGVLPISHVYGLTSVMLGTLYAGACLHLVPRFDAAALLPGPGDIKDPAR